MSFTEIHKGDLLYTGEGYSLYATNDDEHAIIEWEDECACKLSHRVHAILRRHALNTNFVQKWGHCALLVRRLEPIGLAVVAHATQNDTRLQFVGSEGTVFSKEEAAKAPGAKPTRLDMMEDTALHSARTLRAHLAPAGVKELELRLSFGIASTGECQMQVINPLECQLGSTDYDGLCTQLGGDQK